MSKVINKATMMSKKISNNFIQNTIQSNNIVALKTVFYLATVLEGIKPQKDTLVALDIDLRDMVSITGLSFTDIRNNLISMQKTSIKFLSDLDRVEEHISLIPYIKIHWGKNTVNLRLFDKIINLILSVKRDYTYIDIKELLGLKNKHSIRLLPLLYKIGNYSDHIAKRKHFSLNELNEFFGTDYKRFIDIERKILAPCKEELDNNSKVSFTYVTNFDNFGKGRPKAVEIVIDVIFTKQYQPKLPL